MKVAVGSENPVKIEAVKRAFGSVWPNKNWHVSGVVVSSGVSDQPMSDEESIKGATQRARQVLRICKADYGVGLEGGLQKIGKLWFDCGWMVVIDKKGRVGIGSSARIQTPPKMMKLIKKGKELGEVNDILFKKKNSKQKEGHFGIMTKNAITRADGYKDGVIMALSRFIQPKVFEK